jgi:hypothetical protein
MNPKLIPILERIICRDSVLTAFHADRLPQSALAYVRQHYLNDNFIWLTPEEQDLIEELPPFADNLSESIRPGGGIGNPDSSVYHLFQDGSLWLKTNAYSSVWADATDFAVEILLPRMELSRMDADLLRAIEMDDAIESVRQDFFTAFARIVSHELEIQWSEARERWYNYCQSTGESDRLELGGYRQGEAEAREYLEWIKTIA